MSIHGQLGAASQSGAFELRTRALGQRVSSTRIRLGALGLAGVLAMGLLISLAAAHTDLLLPESVRPVPGWLAGPFDSAGIDLGKLGVIAVLASMFVFYVLAVRVADRLSGRLVLLTIAALHAVVLLAPPLLSTDVFSYQAYARMGALYGADPYVHGPHVIALDPLYPYIGAKWITTPTAYGPLFTLLSYAFAPLSIAASTLSYKAIATLASLATVILLWNAARLRGLNSVRAVALFGLNPLIVIYGVGGGHNDLLMLAAMMAGVYAVLAHRERVGGSMLTLAAAIKLTAGLYLPFAFASGVALGAGRRRRAILIATGASGAVIAALSFLAFGTGTLHLPGTLQKTQSEGDWHSIPGFISTRLGLGEIGHVTGILLGAMFVGLFVWLLRRVSRGEMDWIDGAAWATVGMLVTASSLLPWYVAWLIPLVGLCTDHRLWRISLVVTGLVLGIQLIGYIPDASSLLGL
ncbi:MAG: glycosyltransferase family 87 protein [Solirubrobacteraceae bacterium]